MPRARLPQMAKESPANAAPLATRQDVSVTNEIDIANRLNTHHAYKAAVFFIAPEHHAGLDLAVELVRRHVGFVPPIGWDHATIGLGSRVDDREDGRAIVITA